jgi:hypothetical protein
MDLLECAVKLFLLRLDVIARRRSRGGHGFAKANAAIVRGLDVALRERRRPPSILAPIKIFHARRRC